MASNHVVEALNLIEEDNDCDDIVADSSSDDDDLLHPESSDSESEYCYPSDSESDEEYGSPRRPTTRSGASLESIAPTPLSPQASTTPLKCATPQLLSTGASPSTQHPPSSPRPLASPSPAPPTKRGRPPGTSPPPQKKIRTTEEEKERWHGRGEEDITPSSVQFLPARTPGPNIDTTKEWTPLMLFQLFFSLSVVRTIIDNTNAYAAKRKAAGRLFKWSPLTEKDFYKFLSVVLFTGFVTVPQRSDLWRTKWPYNFPFPRETMARERFEAIVWSLHISSPKDDEENENEKNQPGYDRLNKIKPLYTEITAACRSYFHPYQDISIDERMIATKAKVSMKQYMKNKPTKWGYKLFVLADAKTGYTWNFSVHNGKSQSPLNDHGNTSVMDLLPLLDLGKGYRLYTDSFYTSPTLLTDLYEKNIRACGSVRKHWPGFPQTQNNNLPKKATRGDMRWIRKDKLLFVKWMDTREVTMCSTIHKADSGKTVRRKVKEAGVWITKEIPVPDCIVDYNANMGGVDLSDAPFGFYSVHHKTKWYKTFFYHFVDVAVVNSFLLYKELLKMREGTTKNPITQKVFREQLAWEMLQFASEASSLTSPYPPVPTSSAAFPSPTRVCMPAVYQGVGRVRKHCKNCSNSGLQRVKTSFYCTKCLVPLCLTPSKNCFFQYHNVQL